MAGKQIDVGVRVGVGVDGKEQIPDLASRIEALAGTLKGELQQQALAAAARLRELGEQQSAIQNFLKLQTAAGAAERSLAGLEKEAANYAQQIAASGPPTAQEVAQLGKLNAAADAARAGLAQQKDAMAQAAVVMQQHGVATANAHQSLTRIRGEISELRTSVNQMAAEQAAASNATSRWARLTDELGGVWGRVKSSIADFTPGAVVANIVTNLGNRIGEMGRQFVTANVQIDGMRRALTAVYGSAAKAEQQIGVLRKLSGETGFSFAVLGDQFKSFTASATQANIPLEVQNNLFESVVRTGATLGLSNDKISQTLLALSQMASKGNVSMEELRGQLGESLPGALSLAAKGLGLTEQQLIKLVESGGLAARDLFPALAQSVKTMQGENDGLQGSWERLKNAINSVMIGIGDAGAMQVLTLAVKGLGVVVAAVLIPVQALVEGIVNSMRVAGAAAAAIGILADRSTTWAQKQEQLKTVNDELNASLRASVERLDATDKAFGILITGSDAAAAAQDKLRIAAAGGVDAFANLSTAWTQWGQVYEEAAKKQALLVANSEKYAQAAKAEGDALVTLARVRGNDVEIAGAEASAALNNSDALKKLADARRDELAITEAQLIAKRNLIAGNEAEQKAREEHIKTLTEKVAQLRAESTAADQAAQAARNEAVAALAAAEAKKDHAGQVAALKIELEKATQAMLEAAKLDQADAANAAKLRDAKEQLTLAQARLNDALSDNIKTRQADAITARAQADSTLTLLGAQKQLAATSEQMAHLLGDENLARHFRIEQMQLDVKITLAKADAQRAEAQGSIDVARAALEELNVKDPLNKVRKAELEASIKTAEAKIKEAAAIRDSAQLTEKAIENMRLYGDAAGAAGAKSVDATSKAAKGWGDVADEAGRAAQSAGKYKEVLAAGVERVGSGGQFRNKDGWASDAAGNAMQFGMTPEMLNQLVSRTFGAELIGDAGAQRAISLKSQLDQFARLGITESRDGSLAAMRAEYERLKREAEQRRTEILSGKAGAAATTAGAPAAGGGMAATAASSATPIVNNITIGGETRTIRVNDQASADALKWMAQKLAEDQRRAA